MNFFIFANREPGKLVPVQRMENGGRTWKILLDAKLVLESTKGKTMEAAENYYKKLRVIIGKDETGKENTWQVCAHFKWTPDSMDTLSIRLHGRLLEELNEYCGENIKLVFEGYLSENLSYDAKRNPFRTHPMRVHSYSTCDEAFDETGCWKFNHVVEAYCDGTNDIPMIALWKLWFAEKGKSENLKLTARYIWFNVKDDFVNTPDGGQTRVDAEKYKRNVMKSIMRQDVSSDTSIVVDDGSKIRAHKCFLIAHSQVFAEMLQQYTFGRMRLRGISEECVNALLEFVYTFEIPQASKCPKIAVELFVAANKYEMYKLQEKVAKMLSKRRNEWFDVTTTVELFLFVRKLGESSFIDELKSKIGQILKSKGKVRIMKSEGYQKLVADNVYAAAELCAAIATAN